jgi:hypothetical protein
MANEEEWKTNELSIVGLRPTLQEFENRHSRDVQGLPGFAQKFRFRTPKGVQGK